MGVLQGCCVCIAGLECFSNALQHVEELVLLGGRERDVTYIRKISFMHS